MPLHLIERGLAYNISHKNVRGELGSTDLDEGWLAGEQQLLFVAVVEVAES